MNIQTPLLKTIASLFTYHQYTLTIHTSNKYYLVILNSPHSTSVAVLTHEPNAGKGFISE